MCQGYILLKKIIMATYRFTYGVFKNDSLRYEQEVAIDLTEEDIAEMEQSIVGHHYSCEFSAIPSRIYDQCARIAVDHAFTSATIRDNDDYMVSIGDIIPESFLEALTPETQQRVYDNIPDEYLLDE